MKPQPALRVIFRCIVLVALFFGIGKTTPASALTGGPDAFGYRFVDSADPSGPVYNFQDISGTGTNGPSGDDVMSGAIPIGFSFDYYGTAYTNIYVSTNGFLSVLAAQADGCCAGQVLPTAGNPDGVIAGWWGDLFPAVGQIKYQTLGTSPNQIFIVQFTAVPHWSGFDLNTFEFKLFETTNVIEVHYQSVSIDSTFPPGLHSAGIENTAGTVGLQYYRSNVPLTTPLAVRYIADSTPPTVVSHSLVANYNITGPASFNVNFSENVNNAGGGAGTDDVTNPANYRIINKGPNGAVNTATCASALGGDDTQIIGSGVIYVPNTAVVTLATALPAGNYRLFVCGTTSIIDFALNALGGGVDFTFDFTVTAAVPLIPTTATTAGSLPSTGFAPNEVTALPAQPASLTYAKMGDLWLEIPSLKVKTNIVGVPQSDKGWDVTWLGSDTGWLNGTAFPTWEGNSVLTAHVTDANGLPGPLANLKSLKYGDQIIVHLLGGKYIFETRTIRLARPYSTSFAFEHLEDHSYLTLITCQGYNPLNDSYLFRRVVRAVLVSVEEE